MKRAAIILIIALAIAGCSSSASNTSGTTAPSTSTSTEAPTTSETTMASKTEPGGATIIANVKTNSAGNPTFAPLVKAEWKSGTLVLTYQQDDEDGAQSLCAFVRNGGASTGDVTVEPDHIQVIGPTGDVLASTSDTDGGFCRTGNHI